MTRAEASIFEAAMGAIHWPLGVLAQLVAIEGDDKPSQLMQRAGRLASELRAALCDIENDANMQPD